jgi:hypothetical protein
VCVETGAALVFAHHFSKGNKANTDVLDRFSGSGVFGRDPDAIIALTEHKEGNCYSVQSVVRNLPQPADFVVERTFPVVTIRTDLDPGELKAKGGRSERDITLDLLLMLEEESMKSGKWEKRAIEELDISHATFHRRLGELKEKNLIQEGMGKAWKLNELGEREIQRLQKVSAGELNQASPA